MSTTVSPRRVVILTGDDLVLERPAFCAASALCLRGGGEVVLLLAGDLPALRDVLGGVAHVVAVEGIPQPVADHRIDELGIAHLDAVAQMDAVRRLAHALLAAGDDDLGIAVADRLIAERHGAQPRAAELVDAVGGDLERDAGGDRGLPRRVLPSPAARIWPMMTSETSFGSTLARRSASAIATSPSLWAGRLASPPLNAPTGVRAALAMTISSDMGLS